MTNDDHAKRETVVVSITEFMTALAIGSEETKSESRSAARAYASRYRRYLNTGAAGGLIVTISICTAIIGRAKGSEIPWQLALAAIFFLAAVILGGYIAHEERKEVKEQNTMALSEAAIRYLRQLDTPEANATADGFVSQDPGPTTKHIAMCERAMLILILLGIGAGGMVLIRFTEFPG